MSAVLQFQFNLKQIECCQCYMTFAMSEQFYQERRRLRDSFYCPTGHGQHFTGKSEAEELRERLAAKERALEWETGQRRVAQRESVSRFHKITALKGVVTKAKKKLARVDNGVCPECNRTFTNVSRHMQTKHAKGRP